MRSSKRRSMHYHASILYDGTVLAAVPIRKPAARIIKRDRIRFDEDGAMEGIPRNGMDLSRPTNTVRFRFMDIISVNLNTRRAIRELVLPVLAEMAEEIAGLRREIEQLKTALPVATCGATRPTRARSGGEPASKRRPRDA